MDVVECISLAIFRYTILCAYCADYYAHQALIWHARTLDKFGYTDISNNA